MRSGNGDKKCESRSAKEKWDLEKKLDHCDLVDLRREMKRVHTRTVRWTSECSPQVENPRDLLLHSRFLQPQPIASSAVRISSGIGADFRAS